ncbi:MAG: hypothetical protein ABI478_00300 [Propionivibrio sp.]
MLSLEIPSNAFGNGFSGVTPAVFPTATTPANYFVLPLLSTTSPIVRVTLSSPYPSDLKVTATDVTGGQTVTLPQIASGSAMPSTGAFQVISLTPNNPATWHIVVRYPNSFQGSKLIRTAISDVVGGVESAALAFSMSFRGSTVTVSIVTENNDGRVTSSPPGINCPGTCSADFLTSTSVILTQSVLHNQTEFIGWTGGCAGMSSSCTIQLLAPGGAIIPVNPSVTANFKIHTNSQVTPPAASCAMPMVTGMRFVEQPNCGKIPTSQGATLQCDTQGFFCCGVSGSTPTARCPGGNETTVTCAKDNMGVTPSNELLIQPGGCYESAP